MSGGHFDYCQYRTTDCLREFAWDEEIKERFPKLSKELEILSYHLDQILHALDWDICRDTGIEDDKKFEREAIRKIKKGINDGK